MVPISAGYFETLGVRLLRGRTLTDIDGTPGHESALVNQQFVAMHFNGEDPIGRRLTLIDAQPNTPPKPIRIWMEVGDRDLFNPGAMRDGMHDWVVANENMAKALAAKGYHYQFVFARNAGHCDRPTKLQTLPQALEWVWKGSKG